MSQEQHDDGSGSSTDRDLISNPVGFGEAVASKPAEGESEAAGCLHPLHRVPRPWRDRAAHEQPAMRRLQGHGKDRLRRA